MKSYAKRILVTLLGWQVRRLYRRNTFSTVVVVGSIGKSSTKRAIAQYLGHSRRVQYQDGNYNDIVSVPLVFFGLSMPRLYSPLAWLLVYLRIEYQLRRPYPFDVVVLELGTDGPEQIQEFSDYLEADVAVLTAVAPEHMEQFGSIEAVAKEELAVTAFSNQLVVNIDDVDAKYLENKDYISYGTSGKADIRLATSEIGQVHIEDSKDALTFSTALLGSHIQKTLAAAYAVGEVLNAQPKDVSGALSAIKAMPGRMQLLRGVKGSQIIDDTYNASPEAVIAALDVLYQADAPQKIAVLGNMNEMGEYSQTAHQLVGAYCDSSKLDMVIVIGPDAERYLMPAAKKKGINVLAFQTPYEVGNYLQTHIQPNGLVLVKGSQNKVFLEEAIKLILHNPEDTLRLVRQSEQWLKLKQQMFSHKP